MLVTFSLPSGAGQVVYNKFYVYWKQLHLERKRE